MDVFVDVEANQSSSPSNNDDPYKAIVGVSIQSKASRPPRFIRRFRRGGTSAKFRRCDIIIRLLVMAALLLCSQLLWTLYWFFSEKYEY